MADYIARQDPFDLNNVRDHQDYARVVAQLIERGRREQRQRSCQAPRPMPSPSCSPNTPSSTPPLS
jgi:hypothetical protein